MEAVKDEIRLKIIHPLTHPELYKAYGKAIGGGILMYGPPGCGKTHLARATAGEIKAGFIAVGINDVLDMWIGQSERNLHARLRAGPRATSRASCSSTRSTPSAPAAPTCAQRRAGSSSTSSSPSWTACNASNDGVLILAATNAPWHLDSAFRRPGRFDRILFVPPPGRPGAGRDPAHPRGRGSRRQEVDFDQVAEKTDDFSGADLKAVVDVAIEAKLREAMQSGVPKPLTTKDLLAAAARSSRRRRNGSPRRATTRSTPTRAACTTTSSSTSGSDPWTPDRFARARILLEQHAVRPRRQRSDGPHLADDPSIPKGTSCWRSAGPTMNDRPGAAGSGATAVELAPNDDRAHFVVSLAERKRGDLDEAERPSAARSN